VKLHFFHFEVAILPVLTCWGLH